MVINNLTADDVSFFCSKDFVFGEGFVCRILFVLYGLISFHSEFFMIFRYL